MKKLCFLLLLLLCFSCREDITCYGKVIYVGDDRLYYIVKYGVKDYLYYWDIIPPLDLLKVGDIIKIDYKPAWSNTQYFDDYYPVRLWLGDVIIKEL